jgi:hypothetical protein
MISLFVAGDVKEMFTVPVYKNANECDAVYSVISLQTFQRNLPSLATECEHVFFLIVCLPAHVEQFGTD